MSEYDRKYYTLEARQERFTRLAEKRTRRIIKDLQLLTNCSNKSLYKYDNAQVKKIFDAIDSSVIDAKSFFSKADTQEDFTL